ncbi:CatB-related O-acetyltransferase [Priestia aryabhattai]|uniref:CatB-related O-acetyltransferase n=1 Tax=Priestia aryabhattai TaxID=412384 RepID=UPI001C8D7427|nr:CatB-related O-acetyltransferase [Priestia aryabhattai]MBX9969233.1 CatB-related O-acetyltransferase [Priestia aryabhattai]
MIKRMREKYKRALRYSKYRKELNMKIGQDINTSSDCIFEGNNYLADRVTCRNVKMGKGSYIGIDSMLENTWIGKYTCIAPRVHTVFGMHPTSKFVSIHPAFFSLRKQIGFTYSSTQKLNEFVEPQYEGYSVKVGNDVWIGADVSILEGISIGDGAIIATGAVVTKDVLPYSIVGGVPAKLIRFRFENDDITFLNELQWWNKEESWLREHAKYFDDIKILRSLLEGKK